MESLKKIMSLFRKKKTEKTASDDFDLEQFMQSMEPIMQKSMQLDVEFNNTIVKCKKCGSEFKYNDGWRLFQSMANEDITWDPRYAHTIICGDCFSIFQAECDYKHSRMVLTDDMTHEKEKYLQEKYL
jgi:IS1 family transposase